MSLWGELKRRNVVRVGAAYLVMAWLLIEVSDTIFPRLGLPDWTVTLVIALAILAFPLALFLSWAFELTPEGVKRTEDVDVAASVTAQTGRRLDRLIVVALLFVIGGLLVERIWFAGSDPEPHAQAEAVSDAADSSESAAAETPAGSPSADAAEQPPEASVNSIAVLPFLNMSPDPENEYFADGISEELLNILARIEGLNVASRTSAFSFKGKNVPVAEIAELLSVRHVLEGSVRKQGARVRITAQLIDADTDTHLWSDTYERDLVDIFRLQEEIAQAITAALEDVLGVQRVSVAAPTQDLEAYQHFLRGRTLFYQRQSMDQAIDNLQFAVDTDPGFADAWAYLGAAQAVTSGGGYPTRYNRTELNALAGQSLDRALEIDPLIPLALSLKGRLLFSVGEIEAGLTLMEEAVTEWHPDSSPRLWLGLTFAEIGYLDRALPLFEAAYARDPMVPINSGYLGYAYGAVGQEAEAIRLVRRTVELADNGGNTYWTMLLAADAVHRGDSVAAGELFDIVTTLGAPALHPGWEGVLAAVDDPAQRAAALDALPEATADEVDWLLMMALILGDADRIFSHVGQATLSGWNAVRLGAWLPGMGWLREDPRFMSVQWNYVIDYWRQHGFPPGCGAVDSAAGPRLDCGARQP
jgi:TolB-like protein